MEDLTDRELRRRAASGNTFAWIAAYEPRILHPTRGWIVFEPRPYQEEIIRELDAGASPVINKARQIGISTAFMIQRLAQCVRPRSTIIVTNKHDTASGLVRIAHEAFKRCSRTPDGMELATENTQELRFVNGASIKAEAASQNPGRSYSASCIILDELAYWPWQAEMWRAIQPTISLGGQCAAASTPDMEGDKFHALVQEAQLPGSRWKYHEWDWRTCPEYDEREWYAVNRPKYTQAEWASEYDCLFGHASDAVFAGACIDRAVALGEEAGIRTAGPFGNGWDLAGEGSSQSVLVVLESSRQPACVVDMRAWDTVPAPELQRHIEEAAEKYGCDPWLDETGLGWGILQNLAVRAIGVTITAGRAVKRVGQSWTVARIRLIGNLVLGLEEEQIGIPARFGELVRGLRSFRWGKERSPGADHVMALAIAWWGVTHSSQGKTRAAVLRREPITYV